MREAQQFWQRDPRHMFGRRSPAGSATTEGSIMCLLYVPIVVAMLFFFVLPITDVRTARMKLSAVGCLGALLVAPVVVPRLMH